MGDYLDADVVVPNDFYDIFDLPLEDIEPYSEKDDWNQIKFDIPMDMPLGFPSGLCGAMPNEFSKETKNLSVSAHERTCRVNKFSSPAETTSSGGAILSSDDSSDTKPTHLFKTSSPVSILESSASCFAENPKAAIAKITVAPAKRARTKRSRSRPTSFARLSAQPFIHAPSDIYPTRDHFIKPPVKRSLPKKKKNHNHHNNNNNNAPANLSGFETRVSLTGEAKRCSHCEVTSTPQWREGPMGPKTLCNACGVRYRSGRLFPEYRPAASPTFVAAVHSNSHKKVIEMRNKGVDVDGTNSNNSISSRAGVKLYYRSQSQAGNSVRQLIV